MTNNVALAVASTCLVSNSLDFLKLIVMGAFPPKENNYFIIDFHVCAKNLVFHNSLNTAISNVAIFFAGNVVGFILC